MLCVLVRVLFIVYITSAKIYTIMWILQTTWDRPGLNGETNEALLNASVESSERSDQSGSVGESDDENVSVENSLPPNWIGKEPLI